MKLLSLFRTAGYRLEQDAVYHVGVHSTHWRLELFTSHMLTNDIYKTNRFQYCAYMLGVTPLKGNKSLSRLGKYWVVTASNPGAYSRARYGVSILQHVQHWADLGELNSWGEYKAGKWGTCKRSGFHGCADVFIADGNIQFREVWA